MYYLQNTLVVTLVPTASVNIKPVATTSAAVTTPELVGVKAGTPVSVAAVVSVSIQILLQLQSQSAGIKHCRNLSCNCHISKDRTVAATVLKSVSTVSAASVSAAASGKHRSIRCSCSSSISKHKNVAASHLLHSVTRCHLVHMFIAHTDGYIFCHFIPLSISLSTHLFVLVTLIF